jgi:pimeloyl-ACP methyl ester carboxylesterase
LHRERVIGANASPARWLAMTHGIYGSGGNWRSIARKIVERRPEWGAILVDLRGHGRSEQGAPPHTIAACADDLRACLDEEGGVEVVAGHSFGGKCVLALRGAKYETAQTWVLDSTPSVRANMWERPDNDVRQVWESMRELPKAWAKRDDFVAALVARGHSKTLAQWLAMSLHPSTHGVTLALDLEAVEAMLLDYYAIDLWSAVEDPSLPGDVHMVVAERSDTVSAPDRARLAAEPPERRVHTHTIAGAGHWLHLDAPAAVIELFATRLPDVR